MNQLEGINVQTEASERTLLPAPSGTQLLMVDPEGYFEILSTVVAFVVDRNNQTVDVVTPTGDNLRDAHGHPRALIIGGRVSFAGRQYASFEEFSEALRTQRRAASARRGLPQRPAQRTQ